MTPEDMRRILNQLDLPTRTQEAEALGVKERQLRNYLNGTTPIRASISRLLKIYQQFAKVKNERG